jgi:hypothetical protein
MTGQQPPVLACIVIQQAQRYRFMLCCLPTFTAFDTSKARRRVVLYAHGTTIVLIACSAPAKLCFSVAQKHSYKTLSPNMLSRKVIFPMWLCMGAMDRAELSRVQLVILGWQKCFCGPFHLSLTYRLGVCTVALRCDI